MKLLHLTFLLPIFSVFTSRLLAQDQNQADYWEQKLVESSGWDNKRTCIELSMGLRKMGYQRERFAKSVAVDAIYEKLQQRIYSIPEHAKILGNEYEMIKKDNTSKTRHSRFWYLIYTFRHLQNPASVSVVGDYLDDSMNAKQPALTVDQVSIPRAIESDGEIQFDVPLQATHTLVYMGLRDLPVPLDELNLDLSSQELTAQWKKTRAWYQEVKAGKRAFSFRGQSVEYRFKPDGAWDTIPIENPPDDAIVYPLPKKEPVMLTPKPFMVRKPPATPNAPETSWTEWIVGITVMLFCSIFWILAKQRRKKQCANLS